MRAHPARGDEFGPGAGVAEQPQSWDDLLTMITALKEHDPDWIPFPVAGASIFSAMPFVWGAGGEIATKDGDTWTKDGEQLKLTITGTDVPMKDMDKFAGGGDSAGQGGATGNGAPQQDAQEKAA